MSGFEHDLAQGKVGESEIARWLMARGKHVLPVYEIEKGQYAGPALYTSSGECIVAPDILAFNESQVVWIEAKHKSAFTWHRITKRFVTGIDAHHFRQYLKISELVDWPVWLLFLHRNGTAKDSPPGPSGLYGGEIKRLSSCINHTHKNWGKEGMVYWAENTLHKLSNYPL
jgi:hypothetical protein